MENIYCSHIPGPFRQRGFLRKKRGCFLDKNRIRCTLLSHIAKKLPLYEELP